MTHEIGGSRSLKDDDRRKEHGFHKNGVAIDEGVGGHVSRTIQSGARSAWWNEQSGNSETCASESNL